MYDKCVINMDHFLNKLAKHYLTQCFEDWYAQEIVKQVEDNNDKEKEGGKICLQPVNTVKTAIYNLSGQRPPGLNELNSMHG